MNGMKKTGKVSAVVITKNEEKNIAECLDSVKWADEIIIVDDESADKTVEICKTYTDKIYINKSTGDFDNNKNYGADRSSSEWILSIDADERVTPELRDEILAVLSMDNDGIDGYYLPRNNYFLGEHVRGCGWSPDHIIRLYRAGATKWPGPIHQVPQITEKDRVRYLKNSLVHYTYRDLNQYFEKFNRYTAQLAREEFDKGTEITPLKFPLYFIIKPAYWFLRKYIILRGYRDKFRGFFISFSSALTVFVMYARLWELKKKDQPRPLIP